MGDSGFLSARQIMARYDISRRTVNHWRKTRGFPDPVVASNGSKSLYSKEAVLQWERENLLQQGAA